MNTNRKEPQRIKAKYISDKPSFRFKKGEVYDAIYPIDDNRKLLVCIYIDDGSEEPGYYGFSAADFEVVEEEN